MSISFLFFFFCRVRLLHALGLTRFPDGLSANWAKREVPIRMTESAAEQAKWAKSMLSRMSKPTGGEPLDVTGHERL